MSVGTRGSTRAAAAHDRSVPAIDAAVERIVDAWGEVQALMTRLPGVVEQRFGIPPHRLHVLGAVERGATRIQDIAEGSWTSVSAASRTVEGLVQDGWLDRRPDPDDRRATRVTLTGEGRGQLDRVRGWATGLVSELVGDLGVERAERMASDLTAFAEGISARLDRGDD